MGQVGVIKSGCYKCQDNLRSIKALAMVGDFLDLVDQNSVSIERKINKRDQERTNLCLDNHIMSDNVIVVLESFI